MPDYDKIFKMRLLKTKRNKYIIITAIFILASLIVYFSWGRAYLDDNKKTETYSSAEVRCGQKPVIGADKDEFNEDKIYYAPGPPNENQTYDLLSLYDPANLDLSEYSNPRFFCSIEEAQSAGYLKHPCCGAILE